MRRLFAIAIAGPLLCTACSSKTPPTLSVDLRTDYRVPVDITAADVSLAPASGLDAGAAELRVMRRTFEPGEDVLDPGVRVADFDDVAAGDYAVVVRLLDSAERPVAMRRTVVTVRGATGVIVVITRSCEGIPCPGPGDDPSFTECLGGRCVPPDCTSTDTCPMLECTSDPDCEAGPTCVRVRCAEGACLRVPDDSLCAAGLLGRCDPTSGCLYEACTPEACDDGNPCTDDACGAESCLHPANADSCDDGIFCNGPDSCAAGSCSVHPGDPCPGASVCNEAMGTCTGCATDADCPEDLLGPFGPCGGFPDTCATAGMQTRTISSFTCDGGACVRSDRADAQACTRTTDGLMCMADSVTSWGSCGGFSNACDETGTEMRMLTRYACASGRCAGLPSPETRPCTRDTLCGAGGGGCGDGRLCAGTECCTGVCGDADQDCDRDATDSTRVLQHVAGTVPLSACGQRDGDVLRSGVIRQADSDMILRLGAGLVTGGCTSCAEGCGDVFPVGAPDGRVTATDATEVMRMSSGGPHGVCRFWAADVDGNGAVADADATRILQYDAGLATLACVPP